MPRDIMTTKRIERMAPTWVIALLVSIGLALVLVGLIYFSEQARHLPSFLPGHASHSTKHHTKHGLLAVVLALIAFGGAWVGSGRKRRRWDS